jgi:hypothetical protein
MFRALLLALLLAIPALAGDTQRAIELSRRGDYEASEDILSRIPKSQHNLEYLFYRLVNNFSLNNKEVAEKYAHLIEYNFEEVPQRYMDLALIMKYDMETWKTSRNDLDDISREMMKIKDRLANSKGGTKTQNLQRDVEKRLKQMIDELEDAKNKQMAAASGQDGQQEGKGQLPGQGPKPAQDTIRGMENGTGQVDKKRIREIAAVWGKLQEKERAKAMVELTRNLPTKDKVVIERYLKELQKRSMDKK